MKSRYIVDFDTKHLKTYTSDIIIIGTGIAGLFTALNIDKKCKVILLSKKMLKESNSTLAQGGIAVSVKAHVHFQDTLKAGGYINNQEAIKILTEESLQTVEKLIDFGVAFDRDKTGKLKFTQEGGHSEKNILHAKDATGKEIIDVLGKRAEEKENIIFKENNFAIDIITDEEEVNGVLAINEAGEKVFYKGKTVIIATGGIGGIYKNTTNLESITGDGMAMAYRAGAKFQNMEFVQFHPTALYEKEEGQKFLISEAVRGEGAILRNIKGEAFMIKYHPLKELAPRDIVSRSIFNEIMLTKNPYVYLDITHKNPEFIKNRFPNIYNYCLKIGIDITKTYIPVTPVEHYIMGGIKTDTEGKTSIKGLYACGECACTGVHGSNRLASNSLLEAIVFGNRVASSINKDFKRENLFKEIVIYHKNTRIHSKDKISYKDLEKLKKRVQFIMNQYVSILRSDKELKKARKEVQIIENKLDQYKDYNTNYIEVSNIVTVALLIIEAAIDRQENIGTHYRVV